MPQLYEVSSAEGSLGEPPVDQVDMKRALRLPAGDHPDDKLVTLLTKVSADVVEDFTGRSFRVSTWFLYVDRFEDRIRIWKDPVTDVSAVEYQVNGSWVAVSASTYYLRRYSTYAEVLLKADQSWPTDLDEVEAGIRITFKTGIHRNVDTVRAAMRRHVTYMYENRGDFEAGDAAKVLAASGAEALLQQGTRIPVV